ncbi:MAG: ABC transporter substrate-binding protein [Planctomycetota bacterium]
MTEFIPNQAVVLDRYPGFHGPRGHADRIIWRIIPDAIAALQELQGGGLTFVARGPTPVEYVDTMAKESFQKRFVRRAWYTPSVSFVAWNRRVPQLADARVRAALGLLANRPEYVAKKYHGLAVLTAGSQFVSGPAADPTVKPLAYDPEAAMELLDEAGWYDRDGDGFRDKDGMRLKFKLLVPAGSKSMKEFLPIWIEDLKKAGVELEPELLEWAAFIEKFEGKKFDAITLSWASDPESDPFQLWHGSFAPKEMKSSNVTSFQHPLADALIERLRETLDDKVRHRMQHSFQRILDADQPYTFLWARADISGYDRRWRGVRFYPKRPGFDLCEWYLPREHQEEGK